MMAGKCWIVLGLSLVAASCAVKGVNLAETGVIRVLRLPSGPAWVKEATAYQDGPDVLVTGKLVRQFPSPVLGHLDVALRAPDGAIIAETWTGSINTQRRRGPVEAFFTVRLKGTTPPNGSALEVGYHGGPHPAACSAEQPPARPKES